MLHLKRTRSSEKHSRDQDEAIRERKRRKFLGFLELKKSNLKTKMRSPKTIKHEDGGRGGREDLQNLAEKEAAKTNQMADRILRENSLDHCIITKNGGSESSQDNKSVKTTTKISKSSSQTPSLSRRPITRSSTMAKRTGRTPADQSRTANLRLCNTCNKNFPNLSTVPGSNLLLCSVCRRKAKAVDTVPALNIELQARTSKSPGSARKQRNYIRERNIAGGTPDTAVKIVSSDEEEEVLNDTGSAMNSHEHCQSDLQCPVKKIAYPSRTDPEAIEILDLDIQRLEPSEFLNDTIIDFYIKYIQRELLSLEGSNRFHFFNSFFYKKLNGVAGKNVRKKKKKNSPDFSKLQKWTKGVNIFEKDYLIIPVHDKLHWSLAIVCFPKHGPGSSSGSERCILHLDSMTCGHRSLTIFRLLRRYLMAEWKDSLGEAEMKGNDSTYTLTCNAIPGRKVPVPLQENESDCGLFLLHYIQKFVESAPRTMKICDVVKHSFEDLGVFGREWFSPGEASNLRTSIREKLQSLFAENEVVIGKSSDISFGNNDVVKARNLEAEFREYL